MFDWCIIGGGASGMYASILLAKSGFSVALLEANERVGKKLLATGNGKCNLSNENIDTSFYNTAEIKDIISNFNLRIEFEKLGLVTKVKNGRIYPFSEQASGVLNLLRANMDKFGVKVICDCLVNNIEFNDNVQLSTSTGKIVCEKVCLASGSAASFGLNSLNLCKNVGHKIEKITPALCPLLVDNLNDIKGLNGVRQEANVSLYIDDKLIATEFGEVQFRKDSVSGIVIFNHASRLAWSGVEKAVLSLDFMPNYTEEQVKKMLANEITFDCGVLHKNIMQNISSRGIKSVKDYKIAVSKNYDCKQAQVMHGGLKLNEFNLSDMSSKLNNKLYAIGEVLNVDGLCGGFNLHWAFASASVLAKGAENVAKIK